MSSPAAPNTPMPDLKQDRSSLALTVNISMLILAFLAVSLRLISRKLSVLKYWWDDFFAVISLIAFVANSATDFLAIQYGVGKHIEIIPKPDMLIALRTGYANQIIYPVTITLIKMSLLLFYYRLFGVHKGFRVAIYITGALSVSWCVGIIFAGTLQCLPVKQCLNGVGPPITHHFSFRSYLLGYAIPNVTLDFVMLFLPIFVVWNLVLTKRKKVAVSAVFLLGGFTCGASIARVYSVAYLDRLDITWSYVGPLIWTTAEFGVGITCACLPTLQPLIQRISKRILGSTKQASGNSGSHTFQSMSHAQAKLFGDGKNGSRPFTKIGVDDMERREGDEVPLNAIGVKSDVLMHVRESPEHV